MGSKKGNKIRSLSSRVYKVIKKVIRNYYGIKEISGLEKWHSICGHIKQMEINMAT